MPLGEPFLPQPSVELILLEMGIQKTSELPPIIPPLPTGDMKDLKVWKEYWMQHDAYIRKDEREKVLDELEKRCKEKDKILISDHRIPIWEVEHWIEKLRQSKDDEP